MTHVRQTLRETLKTLLTGVPGAVAKPVVGAPRANIASMQAAKVPTVYIHDVEGNFQPIAQNLPTGRPGKRAFRLMIGAVGTQANYEAGAIDAVTAEIETRIFCSPELRDIARHGVAMVGEIFDHLDLASAPVACGLTFDFTVPMTEGRPSNVN